MSRNARGSLLVGTGILLSRLSGVVRQRVFAHFLGQGDEADALYAAFRIPNIVQNLLGEGALSASFIPAYSRLLGQGREEEARRLANAILSLLLLLVAAVVLLGELTTPWLVGAMTATWSEEKRALTERLVRIVFPGVGMMVLSAWCLGVLNSHRRFLLSYAVGMAWNAAIIVAVLVGPSDPSGVAHAAAWGSVAGAVLQVLVQWPEVRRVGGALGLGAWRRVEGVRDVVRAFGPNVLSRGANQISAYIDLSIAGLLPKGAVAVLGNAQVIYTLPVSLFGMAISAAELPEMSREGGDPDTLAHALRVRLDAATQRLAYYIVPSAAGFLCLGGVIAAAIFQTRGGAFTAADARYVWVVLAGSAIGLLASTLGRLYASTFYVLRDTTTPLRCGLVRVGLTAVLGVVGAIVVPDLLGVDRRWGAVGISASAGIAGWVEFLLLRRGLCRRLGRFDLPMTELAKLWGAALLAAIVSLGLQRVLPAMAPIPLAAATVSVNAIVYLGVTGAMDVPEAAVLTGRLRRLLRRGRR